MTEAIDARPSVRAAQYLRMSTEHQRYSIANQAAAIGLYSLARGFDVVNTYQDVGRSGLTLKGRNGLQQLLADILSGAAQFDAVLVLDVSRWGRFQDPDQSAHYEFICREAGVAVHYCGEAFENDGSPASTILKHLKRVMAGEYSRELSEKLRRAKRHKAEIGQYGNAVTAFGLRRQVMTQQGRIRTVLEPGERKAIASDHLVIIHGPAEEIATIREIFRLYVQSMLSISRIARELERQGRTHPRGPWTQGRVRAILENEMYTGRIFYGKTATVLKSSKKRMARKDWIEVGRFPPIISDRQFRKARARVEDRPINLTREELINRLKRCGREFGAISTSTIARCPYLPSMQVIVRHFGSLRGAWAAAEYVPTSKHRQSRWRWKEDEVLEGLKRLLAEKGYLTGEMIDKAPGLPTVHYLQSHFGGLISTYERVGFVMSQSAVNAASARRAGKCQTKLPPVQRKPAVLRNAKGERFSKRELVTMLRQTLRKHGYLSERVIESELSIPTFNYFRTRFGGMSKAYKAAGYFSEFSDIVRASALRTEAALVAKREAAS